MTHAKYVDDARIVVMPPHIAGHPDVNAMLGAFYSRSYAPVEKRISELGEDMTAVRDKLRNFVVGYGHASILDMCNVTVFIENVPILAAVALEDHPMFAGQETSTRYVNWADEAFINPLAEREPGYSEMEEHYAFMRRAYVEVSQGVLSRIQEANTSILRDEDTRGEGDLHRRAMKARSFDVARGYLPCGAVTRVCWCTRLSSMKMHLRDLAVHPDHNIVMLAYRIWRVLNEHYPDGMGGDVISEPTNEGYAKPIWDYAGHRYDHVTLSDVRGMANYELHDPWIAKALQEREWCTPVPQRLFERVPPVTFLGRLDYGSMRDLHRHRRGRHWFDVPRADSPLHPWYTGMAGSVLTAPLFWDQYQKSLDRVAQKLDYAYSAGTRIMAHGTALCATVPFAYEADVPQLTYLMERRTTMDVHATLRTIMQDLHHKIITNMPLKVHVNMTEDPGLNGYVLTRGRQTITVGGRDISEHDRGERVMDTKNRGFGGMPPEKHLEISCKGGRSVPNDKRIFSQNRELARAAGRKGGLKSRPAKRDQST